MLIRLPYLKKVKMCVMQTGIRGGRKTDDGGDGEEGGEGQDEAGGGTEIQGRGQLLSKY